MPNRPPRAHGIRLGFFWLAAVLLPVLAFFGLLEAGLRVAGYGYPTGFFRRIPGRSAYTASESFGRRFFPPSLVRVPLPCVLSDPKPRDTYRIFVLGGSAAQGFPEARYGMARILEAMLNESIENLRFEVVNTGMTAINSNVVLPIARDCAKLQPDLFVVYVGNNEVIGPYGPGTVFGGGSPGRSMIRLGLWLNGTKTGQLVSSLGYSLGASRRKGGTWAGMEMFLANRIRGDDPRLDTVYANFHGNLLDICRTAHRAGAEVILCTVASNLRDNGPFAAMHRRDLGPGEERQWEAAYRTGVDSQDAGRYREAARAFQNALAIDPQFADLHFRLAQCLAAEGRTAEAGEHYVLAREWDALRFRSCEPINATIRAVAAEAADLGALLVDPERSLAEDPGTPMGVPGDEWLWDHVHLNWEGNYHVARLLFGEVVKRLPGGVRSPRGEPVSPPSSERCAELLLLTDMDRYRMAHRVASMLEKQPFAGQIGHERRAAARNQALEELSTRLDDEAMSRTQAAHVQRVAQAPEDLFFRENLARLLGNTGDVAGAEREWRELLIRVPGVTEWETQLGLSLLNQGQTIAAMTIFEDQVRRNSRSIDALNNLGLALVRAGRLDEAIKRFERAAKLAPDAPEPLNNLGRAARTQGDLAGAMERFRQVLEVDPSFYDAHMNLASLLAAQGRADEALRHYRSALREQPRSMPAILELTTLLIRQRRFEEVVKICRDALRFYPNSADLHGVLAAGWANLGDIAAAKVEYEKALSMEPNRAEAHFGLGRLLADEGEDLSSAAQHFRRALELRPDWPPALDQLARLLSMPENKEVADPEEAIRLADRACQLTRNQQPVYLQTAAAAYAAAGNLAKAVTLATQARERALRIQEPVLIKEIEQDLERYRRLQSADTGRGGS